MGSQPSKDCGTATWSTDSRRLAYLCWDHESTTLYLMSTDGALPSEALLDEPAPIALALIRFSATGSHVFLRRTDAEGTLALV
ncbi:MAG: hypothetical protein O7A63_00025 [Acidobacteria bacterium]|nr:hypothetical protein [Acidobacteriota bacterium]